MKTDTKTVKLEYCKGNEGSAIYLSISDQKGNGTGFRVAGPKCWGNIRAIGSFELSRTDLMELIIQASKAIEVLDKEKKNNETFS